MVVTALALPSAEFKQRAQSPVYVLWMHSVLRSSENRILVAYSFSCLLRTQSNTNLHI